MAESICYLCTNPAWPNWTKVGITNKRGKKKRLSAYQTSSPHSDYEFNTCIEFKNSTLLEDCVLIHFNGASEPKEWINKPHEEVEKVFFEYRDKILKNPKKLQKWVDEQKQEVEGDTYKYVLHNRENPGTKWGFRFTSKDSLKELIKEKKLVINIDDINFNKTYTSRELAQVLKVFKNDGTPYTAIVNGWGKNTKSKYSWKNNLPNGFSNKYGIEQIQIQEGYY